MIMLLDDIGPQSRSVACLINKIQHWSI